MPRDGRDGRELLPKLEGQVPDGRGPQGETGHVEPPHVHLCGPESSQHLREEGPKCLLRPGPPPAACIPEQPAMSRGFRRNDDAFISHPGIAKQKVNTSPEEVLPIVHVTAARQEEDDRSRFLQLLPAARRHHEAGGIGAVSPVTTESLPPAPPKGLALQARTVGIVAARVARGAQVALPLWPLLRLDRWIRLGAATGACPCAAGCAAEVGASKRPVAAAKARAGFTGNDWTVPCGAPLPLHGA
mmetsp:Transcript_52830/g.114189  ORF Transcript_52830/g.114189 Transcript_52830/m.114189 type:complete len:244 (+) Transcript_52830:304-1035(+)